MRSMTPSARRRIGIAEAEAWWRAHEIHVHAQRGKPPKGKMGLAQAACAHFGCSKRTWSRIRATIQARERERLATNPIAAAMAAAMQAVRVESPLNTPKYPTDNTPNKTQGSQLPSPQALSAFADRILPQLLTAVKGGTNRSDLEAFRQAVDQRLRELDTSTHPLGKSQHAASTELALIDALEAWLALPHSPTVMTASRRLLDYVNHYRAHGLGSATTG